MFKWDATMGERSRAGSPVGADGVWPRFCAGPATPKEVMTAEQKRTRKIRSHLSGCVPVPILCDPNLCCRNLRPQLVAR